MSMINISGVPNLGIPGLSGFSGGGTGGPGTGSTGLASAQEQALLNQRFFGQQAATQAAATVPQSQLYGGGSFGAQPAYYAGVGAAYGRAVAPSSPAAVAAQHGTPPPPASVFETGAPPVPYSPPPGSFSPSPNYLGGRGGGSVFETGAPPVPYQSSPPPGSFSPSPNYPGGSGDTFANRFGASPSVIDPLQKAPQGTLPQGIFDGVFGPTTPQAPGFSPASFMERFGAVPASSLNSFANRFAAGGYSQPGQPSEYTTSPYTSAQGQTYQPNIPSGYQTPFSADNPGGALTRQMRQNIGQAPIMNASQDENPFEAGASHIGPTMGPFMGATPGGGVGRGAAPSGFAPSSPFAGGTSPVPYPYAGGQAFPGAGVGSAQGSMRDRIAAIMSGSQGMNEPTSGPPTSGSPLVNGGPGGTGGPVPTAPQMNNAMDMLRQGRGWTIAQQTPPPQSSYAPINQAISSIGSVSRPGMFDNLSQPLGSMFSPAQYRGR